MEKICHSSEATPRENEIREALADFLGIVQQKVRCGRINREDIEAIMHVILAGGGIHATAQEIAAYYNKSEDSVRHLIHRNIFPAPKRCVYYDFQSFRRLAPRKWTKRD